MKSLPDGVQNYKSTPVFTEKNLPAAFLKDHNTKKGVWGLICMEYGEMEYIIGEGESYILTPEKYGVVEPEIVHRIKPLGDVVFHVEFYK